MRAAFLFAFATIAGVASAASPFSVTCSVESIGGTQSTLTVVFHVPENHYLYRDQIEVSAADATLMARSIPVAEKKPDPITNTDREIYERDVAFVFSVNWGGATSTPLVIRYQGCSHEICFLPVTKTFLLTPAAVREVSPPTAAPPPALPSAPVAAPASGRPASAEGDWRVLAEDFAQAGAEVGYVRPAPFLDFLAAAASGQGMPSAGSAGLLAGKGMLATLMLILLGGLALNLTPCVFPLIPINLAIIGAGSQAGSRARGFALGSVYGLGIALAYGTLGAVVVLTGAQFGVLNSSPWFNAGIALVFLALALAMFDVIAIDLSRFQGTGGGAQGGKAPFVTAFVMGAVSALLAGACVAPVLISVLVLSASLYQKGQIAGLLLPFLLGLGMGSIWPFAGAGLSFLPKPGRWMERVKVAFGILILAASLYYGAEAGRLFLARLPSQRAQVVAAQEAGMKGGWHTSLAEGLALAQKERKPVLIDFWASWCKNCLAMDGTTFRNADVECRLGDFTKVKYRAEFPGESPAREVLDYFGVKGLPTYVVLVPKR